MPVVVIDDRLLIEELLVGLDRDGNGLATTTYWYYRAHRAAMAAGGGRLSGPMLALDVAEQECAIAALLALPTEIALPDPRTMVPPMVDVALRHPKLNLLNLEAVAAARTFGATVWLSEAAAEGVLPRVLDEEGLAWTVRALGR